MTPQPIAAYNGGHFNADLAATSSRIMRGGSWKKQRVVMIIPAADLIPAEVYLNHSSLIFPPNQAAHRTLATGYEVGDAYSTTVEGVLNHPELSQWEYIFTIEHDNIVPADTIVKLIRRMEEHPEFVAISGLYFCKGPEGWNAPHIWGDPRDPVVNYRPQPPVVGQLVECCGLSMGCTLYRMGLFRDARIAKPFFQTKAGREGVGTQDLSFWAKARPLGYRCAVDCDVLVGHLDHEGKFGPKGKVW